ncbi:MAG: hypothetical protein QM800_06420 [Paludibacter sp.]
MLAPAGQRWLCEPTLAAWLGGQLFVSAPIFDWSGCRLQGALPAGAGFQSWCSVEQDTGD